MTSSSWEEGWPLVLEQGDGVAYPCNSRQSGGILHIGFHDPCREPDDLVELISRITDGHARPAVANALARNASRFIEWLRRSDVRLMRFDPREMYRWCMAPPRALRGGVDWEGRGPDKALRQLAHALVRGGGVLSLRSRAVGLVMRDGCCAGVRGTVDGKETTWPAKACVIADGGFQSDRTLFERHIAPNFDAVFQRGARTGMGDGLTMAVDAGAALTDVDRFYGHLLSADAAFNDKLWPFPQLDAVATAGIVVDDTGRRLADEGRGGVYLTNMLASAAADGRRLFAILDVVIWEGPGAADRVAPNPWVEKGGGTVHRADTLEQLAHLIGVPASALTRTVADYHEAIDGDALAQLEIPRSEKIKPWKIETGPFMAIPLMPGITYTMGGILIDEHAQVLAPDAQPIPGLFAAGAATGGIEGGGNAAYVGGLIKAGTFGMIAAERVAALAGTLAPDEQRPAPPQGLARFPMLQATLRHGRAAALVTATFGFGLTAALAWEPLGLLSLLLAGSVAAVIVFAVFSYMELIRLVTELLMPD